MHPNPITPLNPLDLQQGTSKTETSHYQIVVLYAESRFRACLSKVKGLKNENTLKWIKSQLVMELVCSIFILGHHILIFD